MDFEIVEEIPEIKIIDEIPEIKMIKNIKKYTKKNGEEITKIYNQKLYTEKYYQIHSDKLKESYLCSHCNKNVLKTNKHNHEKTKTHILHSKFQIDLRKL